MADRCKCCDCGFLASVDDVGKPRQAMEEARLRWPKAWRLPLCFARACDLAKECESHAVDGEPNPTTVVRQDRSCELFLAWVPGFTPKEHMKMLNQISAKKLSEEQRKRDMEWQAAQEAAREKDRRAWEVAQQEESAKRGFKSTIVGAVVGAIAGAIAGGLVSATGSIPNILRELAALFG